MQQVQGAASCCMHEGWAIWPNRFRPLRTSALDFGPKGNPRARAGAVTRSGRSSARLRDLVSDSGQSLVEVRRAARGWWGREPLSYESLAERCVLNLHRRGGSECRNDWFGLVGEPASLSALL